MAYSSKLIEILASAKLIDLCSLRFEKPIFILSAPRSGSSYFYEVIRRMGNLFSFEYENDLLWHQFFPYSRFSTPTDYIQKTELNVRNTKIIKSAFFLKYLNKPKHLDRKILFRSMLQEGLLLRQPIRYIEKTVANCFHLDILPELFPDALYIHLVRDGRDCVSSMIEGWNSGHFSQRQLPDQKKSISHWCYPIPPNYSEVIDQPIEKICAWSWIQHNKYVLEKCETDLSFSKRCLQIKFENFLSNPLKQIEILSKFLDLEVSEKSLEYLQRKQLSWSTVSAPDKEKWKRKNEAAILSILPDIIPTMKKIGYETISDFI